MPSNAFRDFKSYCPSRFDIESQDSTAVSLGVARTVRLARRHEWRQEMAFNNEGEAITGLFFCVTCLASVFAAAGRFELVRYFGEPEEVAAWNEVMREQREAEAEEFNEGS